MLPCSTCAYSNTHPCGSSHRGCNYDWRRHPRNIPNHKGKPSRFVFPVNFDPALGPDDCVGFNAEAAPYKVETRDKVDMLIAALLKLKLQAKS